MNAMPQPQPPTNQPQLQIVPPSPSPPAKQSVRIVPIIRDVAIVWVLTAIGGFVIGFVTGGKGDPQRNLLYIAASNFLLGTVAFTIAGYLAPPPRWRHLGFVALGAWLTGLINVVFLNFTIRQWLSSVIFITIIMSLGGGLSYIFKRDKK